MASSKVEGMAALSDSDLNRLEDLAATWTHHKAETEIARMALIRQVNKSAAAGVGERTLAEAVGVQRGTIRDWLGRDS
jgi:hypothetical protein